MTQKEDELIAIEHSNDEENSPWKLNWTLKTMEERVAFVDEKIKQTPQEQLTPKYLNYLSDYIIKALPKAERQEKKIMTENRMVTINKHETSYEGLAAKFENGDDGVQQFIIDNDKNIILTPKRTITEEDIKTIPGLKELRDSIELYEEQFKKATGKRKYLLKKQIIEMRKDQYRLKYQYPYSTSHGSKAMKWVNRVDLSDTVTVNPDGSLNIQGISFLQPEVVSAFLCNYSALKEASWGQFDGDTYYALLDLENLVDKTLQYNYPLYYDLVIYKIDGKTNEEIQNLLEFTYGVKHSVEYISSLWRKKIPKMIAEQATKDWLVWHYTFVEKGKWKRCSRCGQVKLAHNMFFSKNSTSKDHFYSICKDCRNAKTKAKKIVPKSVKK